MIRNYLLIAWRHLRKGPLFSFINIIGLALGMAVTLLIGLWVWDEVSWDHVHPNHKRLGEILSVETLNGGLNVAPFASVPMAAALQAGYPDDLSALSLLAGTGQTFRTGEKTIGQWGAWVQESFPSMFGLQMLAGSSAALRDPSSLLMNASMAKGLFGSVDVVGRSLVMEDSMVWHVGGVYADLPETSSMNAYAFLLSWDNVRNPARENVDDWTDHHYQLFVQLKEGRSFDAVSAKIRGLTKPHLKGGWEELALYPMDRWHLYDRAENGRMVGGRLQSVLTFGLIGGFVLLLACINFMNLSTAKSEKRAMETGIRKVLGSNRGQLIGQFLGESVLTAFIAFVLCLLLMLASLSWFSGLAGRPVRIPWSSGWWWLVTLGFVFFTGVLAGCYPAFYLSAFQPSRVLKGGAGGGGRSPAARRVLVVVQFAVSMILMIGTIVVYQQLQFAKDRPVGYSRSGLITLPVSRPSLMEHADALRQELLRTGAIRDMAISSSPTTNVNNSMLGYDWEGRDPKSEPVIGTLFVGADFGRTIGWTIAEGRDFLPGSTADSGAFIINEAAVRFMGLTHPVGKMIRWHQINYPIVGVVRDLVIESPYRPVEPLFFTLRTDRRQHYLVMRMAPALSVKESLARIEQVYHRWNPVDIFYYFFVDEAYGAKFVAEEQVGRLAAVFGLLAVVISCLGLFGLAAFVAEQRTREIGIRKVLGATVMQVWGLLSKEFVLLVGIAFCVAAPVAWVVLDRWLRGFEYRVGVSVWVFLGAGVFGLGVALLTVSWQGVRAARMNPTRALRSD
jgi:putative ABC transport system permease protein